MTKTRIVALSAFALALFHITNLHAATLEGIEGQVMVNRGGGYRFVSGSLELKPGDMIIANSGGSAQLAYGDGCTVTVQAGAVTTVAGQSPCAAQANTGTSGFGLTPGTLAIGAVVIGAGVGAAALMNNDKDKPASP